MEQTNLHAVLPRDRAMYSPAAVERIITFSVQARQCIGIPLILRIYPLVDCRDSTCPAKSMSVSQVVIAAGPS